MFNLLRVSKLLLGISPTHETHLAVVRRFTHQEVSPRSVNEESVAVTSASSTDPQLVMSRPESILVRQD